MVKNNPSDFAIFFDDGGVMNDNKLRGIQWMKMIGEYFSPKYGGEPHQWAEGNFDFINEIDAEYNVNLEEGNLEDYQEYFSDFILRWITSMFDYVGIECPSTEKHKEIYFEVVDIITPNVKSAFPGVIDCIKIIHNIGLKLYTSSAEHSKELKGYLRGMRVINCFEGFYGPDLVNTHKTDESFYEAIFNDIGLDSKRAIVIDDKPRFLERAQKVGANVIQACLTEEIEASFQYYVNHMSELPEVVEQVIKKAKK
ncbi:MAG: HAD hydrolase-like protein [Asgard group archaeon]|nr:HAD hydrolase-like protein [Asgard group archaeon]